MPEPKAKTFQVACPHCNVTLDVEEAWIGQTAQCPSCGKDMTFQGPGMRVAKPEPSAAGHSPAHNVSSKAAGKGTLANLEALMRSRALQQRAPQAPAAATPKSGKRKVVLAIAGAACVLVLASVVGVVLFVRGSWERQNREMIVKLATEGSGCYNAGEYGKAQTSFETLWRIVGGHKVANKVLASVLTDARTTHDKTLAAIQEAERQRDAARKQREQEEEATQEAKTVYGEVYILDGENRRIPLDATRLLVCRLDNELMDDVKKYFSTVEEYGACLKKLNNSAHNKTLNPEAFPVSTMTADYDLATDKVALSLQTLAVFKAFNSLAVSVEARNKDYPYTARKTETGRFSVRNLDDGNKYALICEAGHGSSNSLVLWVRLFVKEPGVCRLTLGTDNGGGGLVIR